MSNNPQVFVDKVGAGTGTPLNQAQLDTLVPASPYVQVIGAMPSFPTAGLSMTFPAVSGVVSLASGSIAYANAIATATGTLAASSDVYVDLTSVNTVTFSAVAHGAGAPAQAANTLRIGYLTTSATQITSFTQLALNAPLNVNKIQADQAPLTGNRNTALVTATLADELANLRQDDAALFGAYPNTRRPITQVGSIGISGGGTRLAMYMGTYLIAPYGTGHAYIDVSDPNLPSLAAAVVQSGQCYPAAVMGRYALIGNQSGFLVYQIDNPDAPTLVSTINYAAPPTDIITSGRYALVSVRSANTLYLYDMSTPSAPRTVGSNTYTDIANLAVVGDGDWIAATQGTQNRVQFFKLPSFNNPTVTSPTLNNPAGCVCVGRYLYVANKGNGTLAVIDTKDLTTGATMTPALTTTLTLTGNAAPNQVIAAGEYLYISGSGVVSVVSIKQPDSPVLVSTFNVGNASTVTTGLYAWDRYLAVLDVTNTLLRIFDLSGVSVSAASIGNLGAGRITAHEGIEAYGGVKTDRLDIGAGGAFLDGDVGITGMLSMTKFIRQLGWAYVTQPAYIGSSFQSSGMTLSAPWGCMFTSGNLALKGCLSWGGSLPAANNSAANYINITTTGGDILVIMMMNAYCWNANADWFEIGSCIDGGPVALIDATAGACDFPAGVSGQGKNAIQPSGFETFQGMAFHVSLSAGLHTIVPVFKAGGGGGVTQAVGFNGVNDSNKSYFNMLVVELV